MCSVLQNTYMYIIHMTVIDTIWTVKLFPEWNYLHCCPSTCMMKKSLRGVGVFNLKKSNQLSRFRLHDMHDGIKWLQWWPWHWFEIQPIRLKRPVCWAALRSWKEVQLHHGPDSTTKYNAWSGPWKFRAKFIHNRQSSSCILENLLLLAFQL
jgi:hypothetical protein